MDKKLIEEKISALNEVRNELFVKLGRENRKANSTESSLLNEIDQEIRKLQSTPQESLTRLKNSNISRTPSGPFKSFGAQLQAVAQSSRPGQRVDERLYKIQNATGLGETIPSEGGFVVQSDFSAELLKGIYETAVLAGRCNRFQISGTSSSIKIPAVDESSRATGSRWGGVQGYWLAEAAEKIASKPKFREMELNLKKVIGLCYASDELLQDAAVLEKIIFQAFQDELGFMLDDAIVNGTGAGQPLGYMNSSCLVTQDAEVGQDSATVVAENCFKMFARMPARNRKNAIWLINQQIEPQLYSMSLSVGTGGGPVFMPSGGLSVAPYATLFGRPVIPIEQASALGDAGDICFADMSQYILAEKGGIQADMSIHVQFIYDESVFRFVLRVDGQPGWSAPITPYKGSDDLGPFVILAAR